MKFTSLLTLVLVMLYEICLAGGFQVNVQGIPQTAMGHTGTGLALGPSAQFFNPGALAFVSGGVSLGTTPIFGRVRYTEPAPGVYTTTNEATISTPFSAYASYRYKASEKHRFALGAAAYTPFGSRVLYADEWKGQFAIREISLKAVFIQPTLAWNFNERFGIGGGPVFATGSVLVRRGIPVQFQDGSYGEARLSGSGNGMGFNVGMFARPVEGLSLGLSYRSKVVFRAADGQAEFSVPDALSEFFPNTNFSSTLPLPWTASFGASYAVNDRHLVALDVNYVGWSLYESLDFDFEENTDNLEDSSSPRNYENAFTFRAGWQGRFGDRIVLRGGAYFDMTPVPDGFTTPETPDANKIGISGGVSYVQGRFQAHTSLLWVEGMERSDINEELQFGGTYKARALIPGIGLAYSFEAPPKNELNPTRF